ncbi:enolase C-terminal domain-like protein [Prosthecomicrobium sp. N25]|uniref:enolase C-terminal domain-like protein n=1 Tax=Prosthecomicrobium sp. N25 TaxID=3129254 RepID=UPI0030782DE2
MKIESIRAFPMKPLRRPGPPAAPGARPYWGTDTEVAGPMSRYPRFKRHRSLWRPTWPDFGCLVTASDGTWGFATGRYAPAVSIINDHFAPLLAGESCLATEKLWDMMARAASPYSAGGLASYAISAVDLALWDLKGKILKRPVYELLGGPARDAQVAYATGNDTDWYMELGFKATKLACPHGVAEGLEALDLNEELVARARDIVGPKVELMLDCWMAFDVEFTVRMAERMRPYRLKWLEDYLIPEDMDGFAEVRKRVPWQTLATGEHWYTPQVFSHAAAKRLADIFQPDIQWSGGVTGLLKICLLAEAAGIPVIPHASLNYPFGQHFVFAMPNCPWGEFLPMGPPGQPLEGDAVFPGMAVPKNGVLVPSDAPGFGMDIDLDWIDRHVA